MTSVPLSSFRSIAAAGLLAAATSSGAARAQVAPPPSYTGLDVVFLVDQSGSMGGSGFGSTAHPEANDPNGVRFEGLQQMVDRLVGYRANYFRGSKVEFQTSVVYFGSTTEVPLPHEIEVLAEETGERIGSDVRQKLSAASFARNLDATDHLKALREAKRILQAMERSWRGGPHLQAILMLTDGESYVPCQGSTADYCAGGTFDSGRYSREVSDFLHRDLPFPRYRFFVGAINDRGASYWPRVQQQWRDWTHGNAEMLTANTMWAFFERVLGQLTLGPEMQRARTVPGEIRELGAEETRTQVRPYLQQITFVIHKPAPGERVRFFQNGKALDGQPNVKVLDSDHFIESIQIRNPQPGFIDVRRPPHASILRIFRTDLGIDRRCEPIARVVPQHTELPLVCTFRELLPSYHREPRYRLEVAAEIQEEGGATVRLPLQGDGERTFAAAYRAERTGERTAIIVARSHDVDGREFEVFREPEAAFTVRFMKLAKAVILGPAKGVDHVWRGLFWDRKPLPIEVGMADAAGRILPPSEYLSDPGGVPPMQVAVRSPEGKLSEVRLRPGSSAGSYRGQFDEPSPFRGYLRDSPGAYEIQASPPPRERIREEFALVAPKATARVRFVRHPLWWALPVVLSLGLVGLALHQARRLYRSLWSIAGTVVIESAGIPWSRSLGGYGRHTVVFRRRHNLPAGLRKVVVHQRRGRNTALDVKVTLMRGARLSYSLQDGARRPIGDGLSVGYERGVGASETTRASASLPVVVSALATVALGLGLVGVIRAIVLSLS